MKRRFGHSSIFCHSSEMLAFHWLLIYLALYFRSRLTHILWFLFFFLQAFLTHMPQQTKKCEGVFFFFFGWFWQGQIDKEGKIFLINAFIRIFALFAIYYSFYHILITAHMHFFAYIFLPTLFPMAYEFINSTHRSRAGHSLKFLISWQNW